MQRDTLIVDKNGKRVIEGDIDSSSKHGRRIVAFDNVRMCFVLIWEDYYNDYLDRGLVKHGGTYQMITKSKNKKLNIVGSIHP